MGTLKINRDSFPVQRRYMKTKWLKTIPTEEGWYWMKYKGKNGLVICPASVQYFKSGEFFVRTAHNDTLTSNNINEFGYFRFGPEIPSP
jgi:hypothetical protein